MNSFNSMKNGSGVINPVAKFKITTVPSYIFPSYTIANVNVIPSVSSDGLYTILTITNTAGTTINFTGIDTIDLLCVGGGGGGGFGSTGSGGGGGGGGGGVVYLTNYSIRSGENITIQVGAGGTPGGTPTNHGGRGANTIFGTVVALGGGGGGGGGIVYNSTINDGGSGGGQGPDGGQAGNATQSTSTSGGYGNAGGSRSNISGGGGGGAGQVGGNAPSSQTGGTGGNGIAISITGSSIYYGGGGGGGAYYSNSSYGTSSSGGLGGGGTGGSGMDAGYYGYTRTNYNGTNGLGGGGGGVGRNNFSFAGAGGIGCIIIRYLTRKPANIIYKDIPRFYSPIYVMGTAGTGYNSFKLFAGKNQAPYVTIDNSGSDTVFAMYDDTGTGYAARTKGVDSSPKFYIDGSSNLVTFNSARISSTNLYNSKNTVDSVVVLGNGSFTHLFISKYDIQMMLSWYVKIVAQNPYYNDNQYREGVMTDNDKNVIAVGRYSANPFIFYSVDNSTNIQLTPTIIKPATWVTTDGFVVKYSPSGVLQWVRRLGLVASINGMNIDSSNNIYVCGLGISPFVVFGTDNTTAYKTFTVPNGVTAAIGGVYVVKYSPTGDILLAAYVVTGANLFGAAVNAWENKAINNNPLISSNNEMYLILSGNNGGTTSYIYDSNNTTTNFLTTSSWNIQIIKYGNDNLFKWINTIDNANQISVYSAILDNNSNVHLTGTFSGNLNVYNNNQSLYNSYSGLGSGDVFAIKYGSDSSIQWASTIKSTGNETFRSASLDNSGNYILLGGYNGTLNIYYNNTTLYTPTFDTSGNDLYLIKYNANGTINFATHMGGKSDETGSALMTLDNSNNIYITAGYTDRAYFYNSNNNITTSNSLAADLSGSVFVAKYNSSGIYQWGARSFGGASTTGSPTPYRLVTDRNNNVLAYGVFVSPTLTFYDSGNTNFMDISNNTNVTFPTDFYLVKYDSSGVGKWARRLGDNNYYKNNIGSNIRQ